MFKPSEKLKLQIDYLERQRKNILSKNPKIDGKKLEKNFLKFFIAATMAFVLFMITKWIPFIFMFGGIILYVAFISSKEQKQTKRLNASLSRFRGFYKNEIILPLLKDVDENVVYKKDGSILEKHHELQVSHAVGVEDLVEMSINGVNIDFGEIVTEYEDEESSKMIQVRNSMCIGEFNKNFKHPTFVLKGSATAGKMISKALKKGAQNILKNKNIFPTKHIYLDNPSFNKHFMVFSDDDVEARYILTHTMMERMIKLSSKSPFASFLFINNKIIFNTFGNEDDMAEQGGEYDLFDYNINETILNQTKMHKDVIDGVVSVVQTLELDKKIWK